MRNTTSSRRRTLEHPRLTRSRLVPSARTATSSSRPALARLWKFQLPNLASMVMPSVTLLELTSSIERNWKISFLLHTIVMSRM